MKMRLLLIPLAALAFLMGGCAFGPPLMPGDSEQDVIAKRGYPGFRFQDGDQIVYEYPGGYYGQYSYMARFGPDGRLILYEQVLTTEKFATIVLNQSTKLDVLQTIGHPSETSYLSLPDQEVWSYRYKESGTWNSIMHVHFDRAGIVRNMVNMPDPLFEEENPLFGSRIRRSEGKSEGRSEGRGRR